MNVDSPPAGRAREGTSWMVAGSVIGAVLAFVYQRWVGEVFGPNAVEPITNAWTVMFVVATVVLVPLEQYATRETGRGRDPLRADRKVVATVGVGSALIGAVIGVLGRDVFFQGSLAFAPILAVMLGGFSVYSLAKGIFAGTRRFRSVGVLLIAEGVIRLAAAAPLMAIAVSAPLVGWSIAAAPLAAAVSPRWTHVPVARRDPLPAATPALPFFGAYIAASGAAQMLLASAPLVVKLLGGTAVAATVVFYTFTLFRAPLTLIFSLQGRVLSGLVRWFEAGEHRRMRSAAALLSLVGFVAVVLGWVVGRSIGPAIIAALFGGQYRPSQELAAWTVAGVVAAATAQLLGQLLVARASTGRLAIAWAIGLSMAALVLLGTGGVVEHRVALAFGVGEIAAFAAVGFIVLRTYRDSPSPG